MNSCQVLLEIVEIRTEAALVVPCHMASLGTGYPWESTFEPLQMVLVVSGMMLLGQKRDSGYDEVALDMSFRRMSLLHLPSPRRHSHLSCEEL